MFNKNKYFAHLLKFHKRYFVLLIVVILIAPIIINLIHAKPLIMGSESYYHLKQAQDLTFGKIHYFPLSLAIKILPVNLLILIPLSLAVGSILLALSLGKKFQVSKKFIFFFLFFYIISPAFIYSFSTISSASFFIFLLLLGFYLLINKNKWLKVISTVPLLFATLIEGFSTLFLFCFLSIYIYFYKPKDKSPVIILLILASFLINLFLLNQPFFLESFNLNQHIPDLVSDFGGVSGVSLFILLFALIGFFITWKNKGFYLIYILLFLSIAGFIFRSEKVFILSIIINLFAAAGFLRIFNQEWDLKAIKKFTLLLFFLSLMFSTLSYLDRISDIEPFPGSLESLTWIKDNTAKDTVIFSQPEQSYFITYFADREAFNNMNNLNSDHLNLTEKIYNAGYIDEIIPLLENHSIGLLYITPKMRTRLTDNYGLLFLLRSEMFKLVYSSHGYEVWTYDKTD